MRLAAAGRKTSVDEAPAQAPPGKERHELRAAIADRLGNIRSGALQGHPLRIRGEAIEGRAVEAGERFQAIERVVLVEYTDVSLERDRGVENAGATARRFCEAAAVGMGCALISRKALQEMVSEEVVKPRLDLQESSGNICYSFFDNLELQGERLGEDYSFCYRWTHQLKRKLWICTDERISHVGQFEFSASFIDSLVPAR